MNSYFPTSLTNAPNGSGHPPFRAGIARSEHQPQPHGLSRLQQYIRDLQQWGEQPQIQQLETMLGQPLDEHWL